MVRGEAALAAFDRGGLEVLERDARRTFAAALQRENHTLKRALTDPTLFSGIGNAYSDEILHRARLSPLKLTSRLDDEEIGAPVRRRRAPCSPNGPTACATEAGDGFPEKVTAFRPEMAVHGRFGQPCPVCGTAVQRIVVRRERGELLPALPDRRQAARRPLAVAPAQGRLAAHPRGAGRTEARGQRRLRVSRP